MGQITLFLSLPGKSFFFLFYFFNSLYIPTAAPASCPPPHTHISHLSISSSPSPLRDGGQLTYTHHDTSCLCRAKHLLSHWCQTSQLGEIIAQTDNIVRKGQNSSCWGIQMKPSCISACMYLGLWFHLWEPPKAQFSWLSWFSSGVPISFWNSALTFSITVPEFHPIFGCECL